MWYVVAAFALLGSYIFALAKTIYDIVKECNKADIIYYYPEDEDNG